MAVVRHGSSALLVIDRLKFRFPLPHPGIISAGFVQSVDDFGNVEWRTVKRRPLKGSWENQVNVRSHMAYPGQVIEFEGNPAKWVQGHNLWGSDDVFGMAVSTCYLVAEHLGLEVPPETASAWAAGAIQVQAVDIAYSFALGSRAEVKAWLRAAEHTAHMTHRGRGQLVKDGTLYFGRHSRRWALKFYSKGQEIQDRPKTQQAIADLPAAKAWADPVLRAELVLRKMHLKDHGLDVLANWRYHDGVTAPDPFDLVRERLGALTMTTTCRLSDDVLQSLRPALRTAFLAWESGHDLRTTLSRATFYRYRSELLPHGVDIATLLPRADTGNVIPLFRVLEPRPVDVPDWAIGTPLYWEPRKAWG